MKNIRITTQIKDRPRNVVLASVVLAVVLVGSVVVRYGHAATSVVSAEAESGVVSGTASIVSDSAASGGKAIDFGSTAIINGPGYYVNCSTGSDANSGTSSATPWKTLAAVSAHTFRAGDNIYLADGCSFDGGVVINGTGTAVARITLSNYGSGAVPNVSYSTGSTYSNAVQVYAPYTTVQNLKITNAKNAGVGVDGAYGLVQNVEVTVSGEGVEVDQGGNNTLVTNVNAHDLRMVIDTPGGTDDYGAVGFTVEASNVEISHDTCTNCVAPSDDFGTDGGFVEVYNGGDNLYVHNNLATNDDDFTEIGASSTTYNADNMRFVNNLIVNSGNIINIHTSGQFAISVSNLQFDYNTIYQSTTSSAKLFYSAGAAVVQNNIFYMAATAGSGTAPGTHTNNLYYNGSKTAIDYALGSGEKIADPQFVDPAAGNFHLQSTSPARGIGTSLSYTTDYDGQTMNAPPDAGAFQFK